MDGWLRDRGAQRKKSRENETKESKKKRNETKVQSSDFKYLCISLAASKDATTTCTL